MLDRYGHIRMQAKRAAIEFLSQTDIPQDTAHNEAKSNSQVTVEPEIPVYTDLSVEDKGREGIGSSGFEPLTPTVSR